jgi:opacity protein-like surface antigen
MCRSPVTTWALAVLAFTPLAVSPVVAAEVTPSQVAIEARVTEISRRNDFGIHYFFQNARVPGPGLSFVLDADVIGLGASYRRGLGQRNNWYLQLDGGYGIGSQKFTSGAFSDEIRVSTTYIQTQYGYQHRLGNTVTLFAGGGLKYISTRGTFDDGTNEIDGESMKGFGLTRTLGGQVDLTSQLALRSELYSSFLWNSVKDGSVEYKHTFKEGCFRGTLVFGF